MHPTRLRRQVSGAKIARFGAGQSFSDCLARRAGDAHVSKGCRFSRWNLSPISPFLVYNSNMSGNRPTTLADIKAFPIDAIAEICQRYHVRSLRVFGSVARGTAKRGSDVDVLVEFARPASLLDLVRLQRELSEVLGQPVDLVTEKALSPYIRPQVVSEAQVVYERA